MKYWQKERNYRKITNSDGSFTYIITIDGEDIEVDAEVYTTYSSADRRERYLYEREEGLLLSLDRLEEDKVPLDSLLDKHPVSAEDVILAQIESERLQAALDSLSLEDRQLIDALVLGGVTEREYAARIGITQKNVNKKKQRILLKLKKFLSV
ncbi:sigma-70 family RNA polymerase sigma factor [Lachnospiraceae bacterium 54-53]